MRYDLLIIAIGVLLLMAMVLTLMFGREYSRHGYGSALPLQAEALLNRAIIA